MVRPVLVLRDGRMCVGGICFGSRERAWRQYIRNVLHRKAMLDTSVLFVTCVGLNNRDMEWIRQEIEEQMHFDEIWFLKASPAIAVNCGPGTFGLLLRDK